MLAGQIVVPGSRDGAIGAGEAHNARRTRPPPAREVSRGRFDEQDEAKAFAGRTAQGGHVAWLGVDQEIVLDALGDFVEP